MPSDSTLCRIIHRETRGADLILVVFTRFATVSVFIERAGDAVWQGTCLFEARDVVDTLEVL